MTTKPHISPVLRGNLLNIQEKINNLRPSFPHSVLLQQQLQKAFFLIKKHNSPESEKLLALFNEMDCKDIAGYDQHVFTRIQKEALSVLSAVLGSELMRPS